MKRFVKKAVSFAAVSAAALGVAVLPATSAHAAPEFPCPRIMAVCTWSEPGGQGRAGLVFEDRDFLNPPVQSAQNQTDQTWCFFDAPGFQGEQRREIQPWETAHDFGFAAYSARRGGCW